MEENAFVNVIPSFRFMLIVNGYDMIPCKSIRPFTRELEYDYIQEGGINDYVHIVRKAASKPFTIQVERYAIPKTEDPVSEGTVYQIPMQLVIGENHGRSFERKRTYILLWPRILNKEIGALDAERSGLLTETITIAYSHMVLMHSETSQKGYVFKKGKKPKPAYGLGTYKRVEANEVDQDTFKKLADEAAKWQWDPEGAWRGDGTRRARKNSDELRQGSMKQKARKSVYGQAELPGDRETFEKRARKFVFGNSNREDYDDYLDFLNTANDNKWLWGENAEDFLGAGALKAERLPEEGLYKRKRAAAKRAWRYDRRDPYNTLGRGHINAQHNEDELDQLTLETLANANLWLWGDKESSFLGEGRISADSLLTEKRLNDMEKAANNNAWEYDRHDAYNTLGAGHINARHNEDELDGFTMEDLAYTNLWLWGDKDGSFEGEGWRSADSIITEKRLNEMKEAAERNAWEYDKHDAYNTLGAGHINARHNEDELDGFTMEDIAYTNLWLWGDKGGSFEGEGWRSADTRSERRIGDMKGSAGKNRWVYDSKDPKNMNGTGKRSTSNPKEELRRTGMSGKAKKWTWGKGFPGGGVSSSERIKDEARRSAFETNAEKRLWSYDKDPANVNGRGTRSAERIESKIKAGAGIAAARFWKWTKDDKHEGEGTQSATHIKDELRKKVFLSSAKKYIYGSKEKSGIETEFITKAQKSEYGKGPKGNDRQAFEAKARKFAYGSGKDAHTADAFKSKAIMFTYGTGEGSDLLLFIARAKKFTFGTKGKEELSSFKSKAKKFAYGSGKNNGDKESFKNKARTYKYKEGKDKNAKSRFTSKARKPSDFNKNKNEKTKSNFKSKAKLMKYGQGKDLNDRSKFESKARLWPKTSSAITLDEFLKR